MDMVVGFSLDTTFSTSLICTFCILFIFYVLPFSTFSCTTLIAWLSSIFFYSFLMPFFVIVLCIFIFISRFLLISRFEFRGFILVQR